MRRGKDRLIGAALCLLLLFGAGCSPAPGADQETLDRELDVQLGLLAEVITQEERSAAMDLWMRLRPGAPGPAGPGASIGGGTGSRSCWRN